MEHVGGNNIEDTATEEGGVHHVWNFDRLSETCRLYVWARLLEAENWLRNIGVDHGDLFTRNIMLDPPPRLDDNSVAAAALGPRVVIIDFDRARLGPPGTLSQGGRLPPNPAVKWWPGFHSDIKSWTPKWWKADLPRRRIWLLKEFGEGNRDKYQEHADLGDVRTLTKIGEAFIYNVNCTNG